MKRDPRMTQDQARAQLASTPPAGRVAALRSLYWRLYRSDWLRLLGENHEAALAEPSDLIRRALASSTPAQLVALMNEREGSLWERMGDYLLVYRGCDSLAGPALRWRLRREECGDHALLVAGRVPRTRAALKLGASGAEIISADVQQTGLLALGRREAQALSG